MPKASKTKIAAPKGAVEWLTIAKAVELVASMAGSALAGTSTPAEGLGETAFSSAKPKAENKRTKIKAKESAFNSTNFKLGLLRAGNQRQRRVYMHERRNAHARKQRVQRHE